MASRLVLLVLASVAFFGLVSAHGRLVTPTPRSAGSLVNRGTCTDIASDVAPVAEYKAGDTVTWSWYIQTCHCPGSVLWRISYTGSPADLQSIGPTTATSTEGDASVSITLPADKTCDNCLVEWRWDNSEGVPYMGCAKIKISGVNKQSVFCRAGLIKCNSASSLTYSALVILFAVFAALL